jgi:Thiamine pyrophosphate enzyme, C-terminal TPP binding domain
MLRELSIDGVLVSPFLPYFVATIPVFWFGRPWRMPAPNAFGAQLAYPGRQTIALCGDGGFTMLGLGDLSTQVQRKIPVVQIILNNESIDFVKIEQQEAGIVLKPLRQGFNVVVDRFPDL